MAAEFHHRTGGNPLQVRQLLYRAQREGALIPVGPGGRPTWDLRVLTSIEVTATAAEFLGRYLDQLRPTDRAVLSSLTCIGGEFDLDDATAAAAQPPDVVAQALWSASNFACSRPSTAAASGSPTRSAATPATASATTGWPRRRARRLSDDDMRDIHLRIGRRLVDAWRRPVVRGRAPRRHRRPGAGRRRRTHPVRRGAAASGAEGSGAGLVPAGPRVLPKRSGPAR